MIDRTTKWGNPFPLSLYSRKEAIEKYKVYLLNNEKLMSEINELEGKVLGCWCKPKPCHGDVLVEIINSLRFKNIDGLFE